MEQGSSTPNRTEKIAQEALCCPRSQLPKEHGSWKEQGSSTRNRAEKIAQEAQRRVRKEAYCGRTLRMTAARRVADGGCGQLRGLLRKK
jgi:hypothetical protein